MFLETYFWQVTAVIMAVSIFCAALVVYWFCKTRYHAVRVPRRPPLQRWQALAVGWPVLCAALIVVIAAAPGRTGEQRVCDAFFMVIPQIFFAVGMTIWRRLLTERGNAVTQAVALVVSEGRRVHAGSAGYFPAFEFQAGGETFRVISRSGSSSRLFREGESVTLFYTPENPALFYVPALQRQDRRLANFLCGVGILFPLAGFFAPLLRMVIPA